MGQVTVWQMTEEERLAYIKKHPIVKSERPKPAGNFGFDTVDFEAVQEHKKEALRKAREAKAAKQNGKLEK